MNLRTWLILVVVVIIGCSKAKKDDGPPCRQIVAYMMRFPEFGAFDERAAIEQCKQQKWTGAQRKCMYGAKDIEAMGKCVPAIKIDPATKPPLRMPDWHPRVDQPIETATDRAAAAAAAGSNAAPAPPTPATPAPAPAPTPAPVKPETAPANPM
jgi:hypothetical protein